MSGFYVWYLSHIRHITLFKLLAQQLSSKTAQMPNFETIGTASANSVSRIVPDFSDCEQLRLWREWSYAQARMTAPLSLRYEPKPHGLSQKVLYCIRLFKSNIVHCAFKFLYEFL